jgi:hypothetical protein
VSGGEGGVAPPPCVEMEVNGEEGRSPHLKRGERRGGRGCQGVVMSRSKMEGGVILPTFASKVRRAGNDPSLFVSKPIENESGGC